MTQIWKILRDHVMRPRSMIHSKPSNTLPVDKGNKQSEVLLKRMIVEQFKRHLIKGSQNQIVIGIKNVSL